MSEIGTAGETRAEAAATAERAVSHIYRAAKARMRSLATRFHPDLHPIGYGVLRFILDEQPARSSDIAASLGMDKGAVSRQVGQLRDMGLVDTQQDPADGRAIWLVPSARTLAVLETFRSESADDFGRVFAEWSTEDLREFGRLLTQFNDSVR
jgi:DNA-binding MarR family transcriptional regulator